MDAGGLAQMNYNNASFVPSSFAGPTTGFASHGKRNGNMKRLSVAMQPISSSSVSADGATSPLPRATSRSHLLAGLRTAPKSPGLPTSQTYHQLPAAAAAAQAYRPGFASYASNAGLPRSATMANLGNNQHAIYAGQQNFSSPDQVLAPPQFYGQQDDVDPAVLEQLQLTGQFLAQRQQQLQIQLANITAAASQLQGLNGYQQQLQINQQLQQQMQMTEHVAQPNMQLMYDSATGQYQYAAVPQQQYLQRSHSPMAHSMSMHNLSAASSAFEPSVPTFRAEISPPPLEKASTSISRSDTPVEHVQPLPPPSANAFRRGHQKKNPSISMASGDRSTGGLTRNNSVNTFGPGGARVGVHPIRQPRGPPGIEELIALPTANHEGSKNFAARRRRQALNNLVRAGSIRREASSSPVTSPTSESGLSLHSEADEPGLYRQQSPIGSEVKQSSRGGAEGPGSTSSNDKGSTFDMGHFMKQLPAHIRQPIQAQAGQRKMLGAAANLAEKRRSFNF